MSLPDLLPPPDLQPTNQADEQLDTPFTIRGMLGKAANLAMEIAFVEIPDRLSHLGDDADKIRRSSADDEQR